LENAAHVDADLAIHISLTRSIAHQSAGFGKFAGEIDRWNPAVHCRHHKLYATATKQWIGSYQQRIDRLRHKPCKDRVYVTIGTSIKDIDLPPNRRSRTPQIFDNGLSHRIVGIGKHCKASGSWQQSLQQPKLLGAKFCGHRGDTGYIAARAVETCDQAGLDRV